MSHLDLNQTEETLQTNSLGEKLNLVIENLPPNGVTLIEILEIIGKDSLMLVTIFLSLVFLVPVSIPGVSTVFGSAILLIGITQLFQQKLWLPKRIANRSLSTQRLTSGLNRALVWFHRLEKISRPHRLGWFANSRAADLLNKLSFILAAILLMVPFGFIPFSNTLPAVALIFLAVGLIQKDGGSILLGHLSNGATIIYFSVLVAGGGMTIYELFRLMMAG